MRDCYTIDIEAALVEALEDDDWTAFAPPVSADLAPYSVYVYRVGGSRQSYVIDQHQVSIDCYADSCAEAMYGADILTGWLGKLTELGGVPVYYIRITTLPYNNPDPANRQLSRATFAATIATRVTHRTEAANDYLSS